MVRISTLMPLIVSASAGIIPRQANPTPVVTIQGSWLENIAVRPNGNLLLTRMDRGEVWEYDFASSTSAKLVEFEGATASAGIAELEPDVWAVVAGQYSMAGGNTPGSWAVHRVDLSDSEAATSSSEIAKFPESGIFNGLARLNATHVLPGDANKGAVFILDTTTGDYSVLKTDASMQPGAAFPFGIDGMKVHEGDGALYFTNIATNTLMRVPISEDGVAGNVEKLPANVGGDDFAFGSDGLLYLATNMANSVVSVDTATGQSTRIGAATGSTAVAFGRREGIDEGTLYVTTSGGQVLAFDVL